MVRRSVKKKQPVPSAESANRTDSSRGEPVTRTYAGGKKLFGKHAGSFVFRRKKKASKTDQLKLKL